LDPEPELSRPLTQRLEDKFGIAAKYHKLKGGKIAGAGQVHTDSAEAGIGVLSFSVQ